MSRRKTKLRSSKRAQPVAAELSSPRDRAPANLARSCAAAVLLAGAVWAIYGRAVSDPLIFDDDLSVVDNSSIRALWPLVGDVRHPGPLRPPCNNPMSGRPLVNLTLAVNYYFGELDPTGYHVLNVCLHLLSALVLFAIVRQALRLPYFGGKYDRAAGPLALVVALLWAVHPLQTETVIYVTQRTELMVALFYLATLYAALRCWAAATRGAQATWLVLAVMASAAGMASKEVMVSVPVVVLLLERTLVAGSFGRALRRSWPLYAGLAATWGLLFLLNYDSPRGGSAGFHLGLPAYLWWFTQAKVLWMYLKLVVWPWPLAIHYGTPYVDTLAAAWPWLLGTAVLAIGTLVLLWRNHPVGLLGAWMAAILAPTFIVPITTEVAAERRMYLPLAALAVLAVVGGYWLVQQAALRLSDERNQASVRRWLLRAAGGVAVLLVVCASVASAQRLDVYRDAVTLWQDTVATQPDDSMACYNLAVALADRGRLQEAIACYRRAIELKRDYGNAHYNLGNLLAREGQSQEAIEYCRSVLRIHPDDADAHFNLGLILAGAGEKTQAIDELELALKYQPDSADADTELGRVLADVGRTEEAITHLERATKLKPADPHVAYCYGIALLKANRIEEAIQRFRYTLELNPNHADAENSLAFALERIGQTDEAIQHARRAVELGPDQFYGHNNLGVLLLGRDRVQEAIAEFRIALRLDATQWDTHVSLAGALWQTGQLREAIKQYEQAVRLKPDNLTIYSKLAEAYVQANQPAKAVALIQDAVRIARSQGQTALADKLEAWLADYRAGRKP